MILSNERAFLAVIKFAEGTAKAADPYRVCYSYKHTIRDMADHPAVTGEWRGEKLPAAMCRGAGLKPGCVSTAAGAYQIIKPTWLACKRTLKLPDFSRESQDRAALLLIAQRGALTDIHNGDLAKAVDKCSAEWASLPGNTAGQPQRAIHDLIDAFRLAGGKLA